MNLRSNCLASQSWIVLLSLKLWLVSTTSNLSREERLKSPCTFPTPFEDEFYDECRQVLSYAICDPSTILFPKDLPNIDSLVVSLAEAFRIPKGLVVIFIQTLGFPDERKDPNIWECYPRNSTRFYSTAQWARRDDETVKLIQESADILRERWFDICQPSVVLLIVDRVEGMKKTAKLPFFALSHNFVHMDEIFDKNLEPNMESFMEIPRLSSARISRSAIGLMERIVRVMEESKEKLAAENSIPTWAIGTFTSCFLIVVACLLIEKFCLSSAEAQKKSQMKRSSRKEPANESWKMGGLLATALRKQADFAVTTQAKI